MGSAEQSLKRRTILRLYQSHPNLFKMMLSKSLFTLLIAYLLISHKAYLIIPRMALESKQIIPLQVWGIIWLIVGLLIAFGITLGVNRYRFARWGLILGALVGGYWAVGFWSLFILNKTTLINAPLLWTMYTITLVSWSSEPNFNPLSKAVHDRSNGNGLPKQ